MKIGRGSGKWNTMVEEMKELLNRDSMIFRASKVSEMNSIIEDFGKSHEILDVVFHIREGYVEAWVIYNY